MTLLTCVFAAIICSILWYKHAPDNTMRLGTLSLMYWGASLMWLGDAIFEYAELHEAFFTPEPIDMLNDFYLGLSVVALGLIIWLVILLMKDPKGSVKASILKKKYRSTSIRRAAVSLPGWASTIRCSSSRRRSPPSAQAWLLRWLPCCSALALRAVGLFCLTAA